MIRNLVLTLAVLSLAACTPEPKTPRTIDTTCSTVDPTCWRDSWPDDAIAQAKIRNAKLFAACPSIKERIREICTGISANIERYLRELEQGYWLQSRPQSQSPWLRQPLDQGHSGSISVPAITGEDVAMWSGVPP